MIKKTQARHRRGLKTKFVIINNKRPRLVVFRSGVHTYGQLIVREEREGVIGSYVIASCSTLDKEIRETLKGTKSERAREVGKVLAERAKKVGVIDIAFDRAGYKYHGRVKALAEGAREAGLNF